MANKEPFYERFSRLLDDAGLSDTEAAAAMGLSGAQISRIRNGIAGSIRFEDGLRLCDRLGIDPWYLAFGKARESAKERHASSLAPDTIERRLSSLEAEVQAVLQSLNASGVSALPANRNRRRSKG